MMKFIFTCPKAHRVFETEAFRIIEDEGVQTTPTEQKVWKARIALSAPCPLCGDLHTYDADELPCPFARPEH